eukprot:gnl/TRDRNA2_/TRDRNA2_133501_c0_seq1.p1 gnl/TRDRNA2_/TRDRNA2_133501_c0~~gnl/TRDRNA2_/TRDRNA2_133501_c0_seq1.p1  ORF type:complete len:146 (+),score=28.18 gnl/TRDRNA2_/TRDRNA2_133501_c0_seq1:141-578(+)
MTDGWAWGVQQRLAHACAPQVTAFVRCCKTEQVDAPKQLPPLMPPGRRRGVCDMELDAVACCVALTLHGKGFEACAREFNPIREAASASCEVEAAPLQKGWSCAWRYYRQPLEQMVTNAQAVGECRPAAPVRNTGGKGFWTAPAS